MPPILFEVYTSRMHFARLFRPVSAISRRKNSPTIPLCPSRMDSTLEEAESPTVRRGNVGARTAPAPWRARAEIETVAA